VMIPLAITRRMIDSASAAHYEPVTYFGITHWGGVHQGKRTFQCSV